MSMMSRDISAALVKVTPNRKTNKQQQNRGKIKPAQK